MHASMTADKIRDSIGRRNARERTARVWILRQTKDSSEYAGGLDLGQYGKAKCWGNDSQSMDSEAN